MEMLVVRMVWLGDLAYSLRLGLMPNLMDLSSHICQVGMESFPDIKRKKSKTFRSFP